MASEPLSDEDILRIVTKMSELEDDKRTVRLARENCKGPWSPGLIQLLPKMVERRNQVEREFREKWGFDVN